MVETSFQLRNVHCEYSLSAPCTLGRSLFPSVRHQIPTFHIFGITSSGKKACVHVHGVLPYVLLRIGSEFTAALDRLMKDKINRLIQRELEQNERQTEREITRNFVYRIEPVLGRSIYGYHEEEELFAKIFLFNPVHRTKLLNALARELEEFPIMQPFEAHTPFVLQFFIDNSIFGMDDIFFKRIQYRIGSYHDIQDTVCEGLTISDVIKSTSLLSPLTPITSCAIECDAMVFDIMNKKLHSANVHSCNPGLEYIWREEVARCVAQGRKFEDTFNNYTPRPYWRSQAERDLLCRLEKLALKMRRCEIGENSLITIPTLDESAVSGCSTVGEGDNMDVTVPWMVDSTKCELLVEPEKAHVEVVQDENDADTLVEDALMTQVMESLKADDENNEKNEVQPLDIEELFYDYELPPQPSDSSITQSRWVTLDIDLPLMLRDAKDVRQSASYPSNVTGFEYASFHPMPMDVAINDTAILSTSTCGGELDPEDAVSEVSGLSAASLELLVLTQASIPDPEFDPILGFSFCLVSDACRSSSPTQHQFFTTLPVQSLLDEGLSCVPDERSLLEHLEVLVKKCDPDILFGYDTTRLSWGYVLKRASIIGCVDFHKNISRYTRDYHALLDRHYDLPECVVPPFGRLLRAVWRILRSELQLRSYDKATATMSVLKKKLAIFDDRSLCQELLSSDKPRYSAVAKYINKLSLLNISLLSEINWFLKTAEMARVYGIQFHEVWSRGSQLRVESMMFRLAHTQHYYLPSVTPSQRLKMEAPEQLQLIMEPLSGVYFDPVIVLDFQSLYPSVVIAYNYCFSTVFGKVSELERIDSDNENVIEIGALKYTVQKSSLVECVRQKKLHCSPLSAAFVTHLRRNGILPTLLREVIGARIMVKKSMKHAVSKRLKRILDARQLALKLVANVTYGYTSANFSGRMPCVEVADAILGKGRETLERAINLIKEGDYGGAKVIYGDTDSMFVLVPGATKAQAFAIGRRIAADVTNGNPDPVVLKLEKVYVGCVLETKKRYAGWMYESEEDDVGQLDAKGIETIRRDTCPVVAKVLERSLKLIFTKNWRALGLYLNTKLSRLKELPYTDFIFCKEFRGEYSENAKVPQLKVALSLAASNPSHITLVGERLPYIVTDGPPNATVISCVRSLHEFLADPSLQIHFIYYAHVHILPALRRVTDLLQLSIRWHPEGKFSCFTPGCMTRGSDPWCSSCVDDVSTFQFALSSFAREERLRAICRFTCDHCQKNPLCNMRRCQNHQCAIKQVWNSLVRSKTARAVSKHRLYLQANGSLNH